MTQGKPAFATLSVALALMSSLSEARALTVPAPTDFFPLTPCRVIDTRLPPGPLGGPALVAGADRAFPLTGACGIASDATAVSVNIVVTGATVVGNLRLHPGGTPVPLVSAINYSAGQTRSNNAVVALSPTGELAAFVGGASGTVDLILDVNGYFAPPGSLTKTPGSSGDGQTGVQGTPLANPLSVTVTDGHSMPASGIPVSWAMLTGGGSVGGPTSVTNGSGIATQTATLGATGGAHTYTATVAGRTGSPVTFTATAAKVIAKSTNSGDDQTGVQGTVLANPLSVTVTDGSGNPVGGIVVTWAMETGGGSVGGPTSVTDTSGVATQTATLGAAGGANTYTATVTGLTNSPLIFSATGLLLPGEMCILSPQCASGSCRDNVCCNAACGGVCAACDLPGLVGSCTAVPNGTDPDQECGGVSCVGYYLGWFGDTCRRKADVSAAQATCGGAGACRTAAHECTSTTQQGPVTTTCNALCQNPNLGTCSGTIAGTCTNVNPGFQTCGLGVCEVTTPLCIAGAPNACVPNSGAASAEICDGVDNNCDGLIDNNTAFSDVREPNNSCGSYATLPQIGSNQTSTHTNLTLYPAGDVDYFRIPAVESDSSCGCCDFFCTDEDFRLTVTLTVPAGAGSYQFCTATACNQVGTDCMSVSQGSSQTWTYTLDGACPANDSYEIFVRVSPSSFPGSSCRPYTLSYSFVPDCS